MGSHFGDSQLVRILQTPEKHEDGTVSRVKVLDTYKNIAPIVDAVVTHADGSSQVWSRFGLTQRNLIFNNPRWQRVQGDIIQDLLG